jgi:protein phosphatase
MESGNRAARIVLHAFKPILDLDPTVLAEIGVSIAIPTFDADVIAAVCDGARQVFERQDIILNVRGPLYVIGDIRGNIFDLLRIFVYASPPPRSRFLFLGDYVDRGEYSIEVVTLLFALVVSYPEDVFTIRGNHEFESTNSAYGFLEEVTSQYRGRQLYDTVNSVFVWMPLIAILNDQIFCVHGGLAPRAKTIGQIRKIKRPLPTDSVEFVTDLVWSDPSLDCKTIDESTRGLGITFGPKTLKEFLDAFKMRLMIRAHQCVQSGISRFGGSYGDLLYTVFSCSQYEGQMNRCGLLFVDAALSIELFSLPPFKQLPRENAKLVRVSFPEVALDAEDSLALNIAPVKDPEPPPRGAAMFAGKREGLLERCSRAGCGWTQNVAMMRRRASGSSLPAFAKVRKCEDK